MAFYLKDKKYNEAEKILAEAVKSVNASNTIKYYLIHVYLMQGKASESLELIKSIDGYKNYRAGLVNELLITLKPSFNFIFVVVVVVVLCLLSSLIKKIKDKCSYNFNEEQK
jgi:uncharacterized protein HemY